MEDKPPDWWSEELSSLFSLPNKNDILVPDTINIKYGKRNKISNKHFKFIEPIENKIEIIPNDITNIPEEINIINKKYNDKIDKLNKSNKYTNDEKIIKLKTLTTKKNKEIENINSTTKTIKITIQPTIEQKKILNKWFNECSIVYNFCINKYKSNSKYFDGFGINNKLKVFEELYGDKEKPAPYDVLTDEVRIFFSNLKSCLTNLKNDNIKHFDMTPKDVSESQSIFIPKTAIRQKSFYNTHLGDMKGLNFNFTNRMIRDSRLIIDKSTNKYYLCIPFFEKNKTLSEKKRIVALDPGEKIFLSYFDESGYGHIGEIRQKILPLEQKIRRYQRILSNKTINKEVLENKLKNIEKKGKKVNKRNIKNKIRNKNKIKIKIQKLYKRIKNIVKELHNKAALHLVKNYEKIFLPKFETQQMLKNKKYTKKYFNEYKKENGDLVKQEIKRVYKLRRLNGRVKFVLNMLSHHKFKMHLLNKCKEYGSELIIVTEEYTSQTCTKCGVRSNSYSKDRKKQCVCTNGIDRDINGSRNIMIKNIRKVVRSRASMSA